MTIPTSIGNKRKSGRFALHACAVLRRPGQNNYRVRVFDMSRHGCRIEFIDRPVTGERIWLKFDGLESLQAWVCWVNRFEVGLHFERPIYPPVFDVLVKRMAASRLG